MAYTSEKEYYDLYYNNAENKKALNKQLSAVSSAAQASKKKVDEAINKNITTLDEEFKEEKSSTVEEAMALREKNAVQRLVNERQLAERVANLGLNDSGFNRAGQTAVQSFYENTDSQIKADQQKAIEILAAALKAAKDEQEITRAEKKATIDADAVDAKNKINADYAEDAEKYASKMVKYDKEKFDARTNLLKNYNATDDDGNPVWSDEEREYYWNEYIGKYGDESVTPELEKEVFINDSKAWSKYDWWKYMRTFSSNASREEAIDEYNSILELIPEDYRNTVKTAIYLDHYGG